MKLLSRKHLNWGVFLINLQAYRSPFLLKRDSNTGVFLIKSFKNSYLCRTPHCYYTFSNFYVMIEYFGRLWVQNWHFWYFLGHYFDILHGCFHTKICSKCKFRTPYNVGSSTILIESLIAVSSPSNLLWKLWIWVFLILYYIIISL